MVELLFVACLVADPGACRERSLLYTDITPMTCLMGAQPRLAEWTQTHPNFTVKSWTCRAVPEHAEREA